MMKVWAAAWVQYTFIAVKVQVLAHTLPDLNAYRGMSLTLTSLVCMFSSWSTFRRGGCGRLEAMLGFLE